MSTKTRGRNKSNVRPSTIVLGTDDLGQDHIYRTQSETIHVVDGNERTHVRDVDDVSVEHWMEAVADRCGWANRDYGTGIHAAATRALQP